MPFLLGEQALGVERRHTAGAGGGDRLAVDVILHVAGGEDAVDVRLGRAGRREQVAGLVVVELVDEELRVRVVADRDEDAVDRLAPTSRPVCDVAQPNALDLAVAEDLVDDGVRQELDLRRSRGRGRA